MSTTTKYTSTAMGTNITGVAGSLVTVLDALFVGSGGYAYGSTLCQGWSLAYSDTNKRVYQMPAGTNQRYLRVDDSGAAAAGEYAIVNGWETKNNSSNTKDGSNTNPFPDTSVADYWVKSNDTSTARAWKAIGNGKLFFFDMWTVGSANTANGWLFGDFTAYLTDSYNTLIVGNGTAAFNYNYLTNWYYFGATYGKYRNRSYTQSSGVGTIINLAAFSSLSCGAAPSGVTIGLNYPNFGTTDYTSNSLIFVPIMIQETDGAHIVGHLPGMWHTLNSVAGVAFTDGDTLADAAAGPFSGKTFQFYQIQGGGLWIETSSTWT